MTTPTPAGQYGWRAPVSVQLSPPLMLAHAAMPTPAFITAITLQPGAPMRATATVLAPTVGLTFTVPVPVMAAVAAMKTPSVGIGKQVTAPVMAAVARMLTPTISAAVNVTSIPVMAATAAMLTPSIGIAAPSNVQFDAVGSGGTDAVTGTTATGTHTAAAGATVIVPVMTISGRTITSVTYGGLPATAITGATTFLNNDSSSTGGVLTFYQLKGVPGGLQNVVATFNTTAYGILESVSYTGVNNVAAAAVGAGGPAASASQSFTPGSTGNQIVVSAAGARSSIVSSSGGTLRHTDSISTVIGLTVRDFNAAYTLAANFNASAVWGIVGVLLS